MEFKDIVVDNDAIVNTEPKELPKEAHDIPQGVKPHLNPNPGYGEDGKTVPAIKTDLVEGERGTPIDVVTEPRPAFRTVQEIYNFLNGIKIKGKSLEEYIDSQGGVTEEELQAAVADLEEQIGAISGGTKLYKHTLSQSQMTPTTNFVLITTFSTPLPENGDLKSILASRTHDYEILAMFEGGTGQTIYFYLSGGSGPHLFKLTFESGIAASEINSGSYYQDVVTEL